MLNNFSKHFPENGTHFVESRYHFTMKLAPRTTLVLFFTVMVHLAFGQVRKGYGQLWARDYQGAVASFVKVAGHQKSIPAANYGLARAYYENEKRQRKKKQRSDEHLVMALEYLEIAGSAFDKLEREEARKLEKYKIYRGSFSGLRRRIQQLALQEVERSASILEYDNFKKLFAPVHETLVRKMEGERRRLVAKHLDTIDAISYRALTSLVQKHGDLLIKNSLRFRNIVDNRLYKSFVDEFGYNHLRDFARDHPRHWASIDCWLEEFVNAYRKPGPAALLQFIDQFPLTTFDIRAQYEIARRAAETDIAHQAVEASELAEVLQGVALWEGVLQAKPTDDFLPELKRYVQRTAPSRRAYLLMQDALQFLLKRRNWPQALDLVQFSQPLFPDGQPPNCKANYYFYNSKESWFETVIPILRRPSQDILLRPLHELNTLLGDEFSPVISLDGNTLFYAADNPGARGRGEDIFVSEYDFEKSQWQPARVLNVLSGQGKEAPLSITADGNQLLIFRDAKLHLSHQTDTGWSAPRPLPESINRFPWLGRAVLSADGNTILFSASFDALESFYDPDIDIYVSRKDSTGHWQIPFSIGRSINTGKQERSPFLHPDNRTLYFSSDGHPGLGGVDVFMTRRLDDTWLKWSEPINLGKEINTLENDWGYNLSVSTAGSVAYLSSEGQGTGGQSDLYYTRIPEFARPEKMHLLKLNVTGVGLSGNTAVKLISPADGSLIQTVFPDSAGNIRTVVFADTLTELQVAIDDPNVLSDPFSIHFDSLYDHRGHVRPDSFRVKTIQEVIVKEEAIPIPGVDFETGEAQLDTLLLAPLHKLFDYLKDRQELKLEIIGHTDDTGTQQLNLDLSEKRALAVKSYLQELGLEEARMLAAGLGSAHPLSDNATEAGRALNRRVEIYIK